jgi:hypothetical protein
MYRSRWPFVVAAVILAAVVGFSAYDAGVAHGIVAGQQMAAAGGATTQAPVPLPMAPYGWYRPWGFGFGFFGPLLFLVFGFALLRSLFWAGAWRRTRCSGGYAGMPDFDDWHRRAHERMTEEPARSPDDDRSRR